MEEQDGSAYTPDTNEENPIFKKRQPIFPTISLILKHRKLLPTIWNWRKLSTNSGNQWDNLGKGHKKEWLKG